jgi:hypothetical protein
MGPVNEEAPEAAKPRRTTRHICGRSSIASPLFVIQTPYTLKNQQAIDKGGIA